MTDTPYPGPADTNGDTAAPDQADQAADTTDQADDTDGDQTTEPAL